MRLAIDFDGTLTDVASLKIRYARERWGVDLRPEQAWRTSGVEAVGGPARYDELVDEVHGALTLQMQPMPGVLDVVPRLAREHELYVVTARHDHEAAFARQWLERHDLPVQGLIHTSRESKAPACRRIGATALLDDAPLYFRDLDGGTAAALLDAPYNRDLERADHVRVVEHWLAFEALCEELAAAAD